MTQALTAIGIFVFWIIVLTITSLLLAFPVEWLWNGMLIYVFPEIKSITYWQALGLLLLSGLLFKNSNINTGTD